MKLAAFILISLILCCYGCATTSNCVDLSGKWGYQYDGDAGPGGEFYLVQEGCTFSTSSHMYHISGTVIGNEVRMTFLGLEDSSLVIKAEGNYFEEYPNHNPNIIGWIFGLGAQYSGSRPSNVFYRHMTLMKLQQ